VRLSDAAQACGEAAGEDVNAYGLPDDLDDALFDALRELLGRKLAHAATEAVCEVLAARRDALVDMQESPAEAYLRSHRENCGCEHCRAELEARPLNWLLGWDLGVR
jgi:hypothetical protein